jgi:glycosyltransferase involved in cell wall biosynthesis
MSPFLTIVTVTFQAEAFLERTLISVADARKALPKHQTIEYLLIDGGSTDSTLSIADRFDVALNLEVYSAPDKGLYDAMNKGLALAKGKYVWFLNAGDEVHDDSVLTRLAEAVSDPADVFYSDALFISPEGQTIGLRSEVTPHVLPNLLSWEDMALGMKVCHQAFIVRADLAPTYEINNLSADLEWEIVVLKRANSVKRLPFVLCKYLIGGVSTQRHGVSLLDRWKVLRRHFGFFPTAINHLRILVRGGMFYLKNGKYW